MQKIQSYLYPNRIELLADLAGFNVEYVNVYQRNVKIYSGIDNTLEFDIKNADQKRIDLTGLTIQMNIMDAKGIALPTSPYSVTPEVAKGLATVTIPQDDLANLTSQSLKYSVTATSASGQAIMLYCDSRFGAAGTIELICNAMPAIKSPSVYKTFSGEIDSVGLSTKHTSAIPAKFYEAIPTEALSFKVKVIGFVGDIWLEATANDTISVNSFLNASKLRTFTATGISPATTIVSFSNIPVSGYSYFRVLYTSTAGAVESVTVEA